MLIETTILVPMVAADRDVRRIAARASALFGGYTWGRAVSGGWVDSGGVEHSDDSVPLVLAVDTFGDLAMVVAFAREIGTMLGEQSVYVSALGVSECVEVGS